MINYKICFLFIVATLLLSITNAQKSVESARAGAQRMQQQFALSGEQSTKLEELNKRYAQKLNEINISSDSARLKGDRKMQMFQQKEAELKALLTQEQYSRYLAFKQANLKPLKKSSSPPTKKPD